MAYTDFAYWYDELNSEANYQELVSQLCGRLSHAGIYNGIVADLGCGTGEVSLRLARAGYDMISVDRSADMLMMFREKQRGSGDTKILLLQQDLAELDLYGTVRAAVSTFDTLNHLHPDRLQMALERAALFTEPGGLLIFDTNTPHKHNNVLAGQTYIIEAKDDVVCKWHNMPGPCDDSVRIQLEVTQDGRVLFNEEFIEYAYTLEIWEEMLTKAGYNVLEVCDGESFKSATEHSQRYLITAKIK